MALFNWQEDAGFGCPEGQVWSVKQGQCIPKRSVAPEGSSFLGGGLAEARGNIKANRQDWRCQRGYMWDDAKKECIPIKEWTTNDEMSAIDPLEGKPCTYSSMGGQSVMGVWTNGVCVPPTSEIEDPPVTAQQDCINRGGTWIDGQCQEKIVDLGDSPIPDVPPGFTEGLEGVFSDLEGWLTAGQADATEQEYWNTRMDRLEKQYQKRVDQTFEDLNVKGLYYSGARGSALEELNEEYLLTVREMTGEFEREQWGREVQRYGMAMQYALGARAQEIQWALGKGQLDIQLLDLALQETLGVTTLQLKEQGLLNDFIIGMYNVGISQETNQIARDQMWINTVALLRTMGVEESEIQAIWTGINAGTTGPPV